VWVNFPVIFIYTGSLLIPGMAVTRRGQRHTAQINNTSTFTAADDNSGVCTSGRFECLDIADNKCNTCAAQFLAEDISICCFKCELWYHIGCVELKRNQFNNIVALGDQVECFCPDCRIQKKHTTEMNSTHIDKRMDRLEQSLQAISKNLENLQQTRPVTNNKAPTFSEIVRQEVQQLPESKKYVKHESTELKHDTSPHITVLIKGAPDL